MKYKKVSIKEAKILGMYPVYIEDVYHGHEPFKIVGIRENQVELKGDFSGGTNKVIKVDWVNDDKVFAIRTVCEEQIKPKGCQIHNINCCGGGVIVTEHINKYWENIISGARTEQEKSLLDNEERLYNKR